MPPKRPLGRQPGGRAATKKQRGKKDAPADDLEFFLDEDEKKQQSSEGEEEMEVETAEQKRLRLAKAYLDELRAVESDEDEGSRSEGSDEAGEEGSSEDDDDQRRQARHDKLSERLKQDIAERKIAGRLVLPSEDDADVVSGEYQKGARLYRGHRLAPTAIALTSDDRTAFSVSKDGTIFKWDVETMSKTRLHRPGDKAFGGGNGGSGGGRAAPAAVTGGADWLKPAAREGSKIALYAAAVSSDGQFLAVGGGDKKVHVFDAKSGAYVQAYPGHKDLVSGLAFREGSHQLFSASFDRTVKIWSLDDRAYVDTLFGHQAELLAIDLLRSERAVTCGQDRSCRVWKVPEESQLIFRSHSFTQDCAKYVTGTDWLTGTCDGTLQLWSQMKKKPAAVVRGAHGPGAPFASLSAGCSSPDAAVSGWVQSVAVCRGSDLVASGAGDGLVRLWQLVPSAHSNVGGLECLGGLPVRGFVNSLAIARSGQFVLAGVGQEPRLGRWLRDGSARNGLVLHRLQLQE